MKWMAGIDHDRARVADRHRCCTRCHRDVDVDGRAVGALDRVPPCGAQVAAGAHPIRTADRHRQVVRARHHRQARCQRVGEERRLAEERRHEPVVRSLVHLVGSIDLQHPPVGHHRDPVAECQRFLAIVGDEHRRRVAEPERLDHVGADVVAQGGIEARERLVEQDDRRVGSERPRQCDALLFATRQFMGVSLGDTGKAHEFEQLVDALRPSRSPEPGEPEGDVLVDAPMGEQRVILEDQADAPLLRWE